MSWQRVMEWILIVATAALLVVLKILHIGVTHYNIFLLALIVWTLALIVAFRFLAIKPKT